MARHTAFLIIAATGLASAVIIYRKNGVAAMAPQDVPAAARNGQTDIRYCNPGDVRAMVAFTVSDGSVNGNFSISNTSDRVCQITGDAFIRLVYDTDSVRNIAVVHSGSPETSLFQLTPDDTIAATVRFPDGPQCSHGIEVTKTSYMYPLSPARSVTFSDIRGTDAFGVTTCASATDVTRVVITNFSGVVPTP